MTDIENRVVVTVHPRTEQIDVSAPDGDMDEPTLEERQVLALEGIRAALEHIAAALPAPEAAAEPEPVDPVAAGFQAFRARARQGG